MPNTRVNPDDLKQALLVAIRSFCPCDNLQDVVIVRVHRATAAANWEIDSFIGDEAAPVPHDCKVHAFAMQILLQREFDVIWPEDDHQ